MEKLEFFLKQAAVLGVINGLKRANAVEFEDEEAEKLAEEISTSVAFDPTSEEHFAKLASIIYQHYLAKTASTKNTLEEANSFSASLEKIRNRDRFVLGKKNQGQMDTKEGLIGLLKSLERQSLAGKNTLEEAKSYSAQIEKERDAERKAVNHGVYGVGTQADKGVGVVGVERQAERKTASDEQVSIDDIFNYLKS